VLESHFGVLLISTLGFLSISKIMDQLFRGITVMINDAQRGCSPPGKFRSEKISKGKLTLPLEFWKFSELAPPPWREVVWASLIMMKSLDSAIEKVLKNEF
jgi:hypothetical protein